MTGRDTEHGTRNTTNSSFLSRVPCPEFRLRLGIIVIR